MQLRVAGGTDLVNYIRLKKADNYAQCELETSVHEETKKASTRRSQKVSKMLREETLGMTQCVVVFCGQANCFQQDTADTVIVFSHQSTNL